MKIFVLLLSLIPAIAWATEHITIQAEGSEDGVAGNHFTIKSASSDIVLIRSEGTIAPSTCKKGEEWFKTDSTKKKCYCVATNDWECVATSDP